MRNRITGDPELSRQLATSGLSLIELRIVRRNNSFRAFIHIRQAGMRDRLWTLPQPGRYTTVF
jgi:hypothetical protein